MHARSSVGVAVSWSGSITSAGVMSRVRFDVAECGFSRVCVCQSVAGRLQ
jgi:hypothetical protein